MEVYKVVSCPTSELSYTNKAILHPKDNFAQFEHIAVRYPKKNEAFVFSVTADGSVEKGKIAFNLTGRKWASLQLNTTIEAAPYKFEPQTQCLNSITFLTDYATRQNLSMEFDTNLMAKQFSLEFSNQSFTVGQLFGFAYQVNGKRIVFELKVQALVATTIETASEDVGSANVEIGLTTPNTIFIFERAESSDVKLIGNFTGKTSAPQIFNQNWDLAAMGIGGLGEQFNRIFRRAFATRLLPPQFVEAKGIKHIKGMLLFGPPGTGKTLIARQIGKALVSREPKIVNGPEILDKYVGQSEANIRALFKDAEDEQAKSGINSGLHIIIFDEIDSLCKTRGSSASSSGVGDNVLNQLLTKIDGVNALKNVLLIGMTNRRDLIDEALLRPGRLELQVEIGLPNKEGRVEIFKIHTAKKGDMLHPEVDLEELAEVTRNFTGAEIEGLIAAAETLAISRVTDKDNKILQEKLDQVRITRADFQYALEHDVKPALGASDDQLKILAKDVVIWDKKIREIQDKLEEIIDDQTNGLTEECKPTYVLLTGKPGCGLTTLAANMAVNTKFPFIRIHQANSSAGQSESTKISHLEKLFQDARRSELSCIVVDDIDIVLNYNPIGPRFDISLLNKFNALKKILLPKDHQMLVIYTCNSQQFLADLKIFFDEIIDVPTLTRPEQVGTVLKYHENFFTPKLCAELVEKLRSMTFSMSINSLEYMIQKSMKFKEPNIRAESLLRNILEFEQ